MFRAMNVITLSFAQRSDQTRKTSFAGISAPCHGWVARGDVLVTRAREMIHVLTSIPRAEYLSSEVLLPGQRPTGRHQLYSYLRYAERLNEVFEDWHKNMETAKRGSKPILSISETAYKSMVAEALGERLHKDHGIGSTVYWGNDGFCIDIALTHPELPFDVTLGLLTDFTRYLKTPDPIIELTWVKTGQGESR
jgi:hypothetical protein